MSRCGNDIPVGGSWLVAPFTTAYGEVTEETFSANINPDDPNQIVVLSVIACDQRLE